MQNKAFPCITSTALTASAPHGSQLTRIIFESVGSDVLLASNKPLFWNRVEDGFHVSNLY